MPGLRDAMMDPDFDKLKLNDQLDVMRQLGAPKPMLNEWTEHRVGSMADANAARLSSGPTEATETTVMSRTGRPLNPFQGQEQTDIGYTDNPPADAIAAGMGVIAAGGGAATVPGAIRLAATYGATELAERKLGLPWWAGELATMATTGKPRGKLLKFLLRFGQKKPKQIAKAVAKASDDVPAEFSSTLTSRPVSAPRPGGAPRTSTLGPQSAPAPKPLALDTPAGGLPARATLSRIPKSPPAKPPAWVKRGGAKAERAWLESQGLVPGAMGPDDVAGMKAAGKSAEEIQAALLRAGRASRTPGWQPSPKVGEKPANWKPAAAGENWKPPAEVVKAGLPKKLTAEQYSIITQLQGLAKHKGNRAAIKEAAKETFGDDWKSVYEFILAPVTRAS